MRGVSRWGLAGRSWSWTRVGCLARVLICTMAWHLVGPVAAVGSSFPELRGAAAALPGDDWWHPARVEIAYARPAALAGLHAGWVAVRPLEVGGWGLVSHWESLRSELVRDARWAVGVEHARSSLRLCALAMGRRLRVGSARVASRPSVRVAVAWYEGRWNAGLRWQSPDADGRLDPLRFVAGYRGDRWRLAMRRRRSPYSDQTLWEGGCEVGPTPTAQIALRWARSGIGLSVSTLRGGWELRLATALDGARAGSLSFVVAWR